MQADGFEKRVSDGWKRRWLPKHFLESSRLRDPRAADSELGELGLVVLDENRSMLKQCSISAPLCTARELPSFDSELPHGRLVEARCDAGRGRATHWSRGSRAHANGVQCRDEQSVDPKIRLAEVAGIGRRRRDTVRDFTMVENGTSAGRPAHDVDSAIGNSV